MIAMLGEIRFELLAFDGMDATNAYNYAEHAVVEGKPKLQVGGERLERRNISLRFHREFCDPELEVRRLRETAAGFEALPFVLGNGEYLGNFVIEEIGRTFQNTKADGTVIAVDVMLTLKEWVKDVVYQLKTAEKAKKTGTGLKSKKQQTAETMTQKKEVVDIRDAMKKQTGKEPPWFVPNVPIPPNWEKKPWFIPDEESNE